MMKKNVGRPKKQHGAKRSVIRKVRLTRAEDEIIRLRAGDSRATFSELVRDSLKLHGPR